MAEFTREQKIAVQHKSGNILISASAGSGKTHTMISRLVRLVVEENVDVNQVLALTFTEKSAIDMKEKLKKALSDCKGDKERIYKQIALIPTCDISTLHAFCARLIRSFFFEVGLSPDFSVADESIKNKMQLECMDKTFKEFYERKENWFYSFIDRHAVGRKDDALKQLILSAYEFCISEQDPYALLDRYKFEYEKENFEHLLEQYKADLVREVERLYNDLVFAQTSLEKMGLTKGLEITNLVALDMEKVLSAQSVYVVKSEFSNFAVRFNFERNLTQEQEQLKQTVKNARDKFKKIIERFNKNLCQDAEQEFSQFQSVKEHTENFVKLVKRFDEIYSLEKREENLLDFNDLEHFALKILKNQSIINSLKEKYKYIFVDEYQDINGVQESILTSLSNDNVFMVGDVKQSIYGFRGCKPDFFANKFIKMKESGQAVLTLNHNFRSAKRVIDIVNQIFNYSMTKEYFGSDYKKDAQLVGGGVYPENQVGRAVLHNLGKEERKKSQDETPRVYDILSEIDKEKQIKDNHIASLITEIINDELTKTYYDVKEGKEKKVSYGDIAILTRNKRTGYVEDLVKGLTLRDIPVVSEVSEKICDFPEIQMMINALKLVDCFNQNIPLASTLLSPIGQFTNEDLSKIACAFSDTENAKENKRWEFIDAYNYYAVNFTDELAERIRDFNKYISELSFTAHFVGAQGVLNRLITKNDIESFLFAENNGKKKVARLRRLLSATVEGDKKLTVKEFLERVDGSPDAFTFTDNQSEDAVKVMTIHASKGLEFPVVIVCGLERDMRGEDEYVEYLASRKHGFAFKHFDDQKRIKSETLLRAVIKEELKRERVKEELRLFYVASTRATFSLHLTYEGEMKERAPIFDGAEKFIDYVPNTIQALIHEPEDFDFTERKGYGRKVIIGQTDQQVVEKLKKDFEFIYPYSEDTLLPLKMGVTKVSHSEQTEVVHLLFDEPTPDTEKGIIAHKIMECFDFNSETSLFDQVKTMVDNGILTDEQVKKVNLQRINSAIQSGVFEGVKNTKLYREKVFLTTVDANTILDTKSKEPVVLQGVIDLLSIDKDGATIVDYKYSSLEKESLKRQYKKQLELYAYAVNKVLGLNIKDMVLVNLFTGQTIKV